MKVLPPLLKTRVTLTLAALKIRKNRLDHGTHKELARAMVKVAMSEEHARERERDPRPFRSAHDRGAEKKLPLDPLLLTPRGSLFSRVCGVHRDNRNV